jgi:hypothetical protein
MTGFRFPVFCFENGGGGGVEGSGTEFLLLSGEAKLHDDCFLFSIFFCLFG